jgi:hypothetical protein
MPAVQSDFGSLTALTPVLQLSRIMNTIITEISVGDLCYLALGVKSSLFLGLQSFTG